ncbi:hypothetical protein [Streptomyces sp. NPDC058653]|uniref:hypothetical protein n=1 Tax=Streptomyces sp. NPDC058653 TaxID=3346576 RepID=UPI0036650AB0
MSTEQLAALLAESIPDGTFGGARTLRSVRGGKPETCGPDPNAAQHRAALEAAIRRPRRTAAA